MICKYNNRPLFLRRKMSSSNNISVATLEAEQIAGAKVLKLMIDKYWLLFKVFLF